MRIKDRILGDGISIHAPREGSDLVLYLRCTIRIYFNPRSP